SNSQAKTNIDNKIAQLAQVGGVPFGAITTGQVTVIGTSNGPASLAQSSGTLRIFGDQSDFLNGGNPPTLKSGITSFSKNVSTSSPIIFDDGTLATNKTDQNVINKGLFPGGNQATGAPGIPGTATGSGGVNATTQVKTDGSVAVGQLAQIASRNSTPPAND